MIVNKIVWVHINNVKSKEMKIMSNKWYQIKKKKT